MLSEHPSDVKFEIGHVLFIDIVGYSKLLIHEQLAYLEKLREIVCATATFRTAQGELKYGISSSLLNLCSDESGNPRQPKQFRTDECKIDIVTPAAPRKSIAVLPFGNLSEGKANVYFAGGIHEEILTRLSRIRDLK